MLLRYENLASDACGYDARVYFFIFYLFFLFFVSTSEVALGSTTSEDGSVWVSDTVSGESEAVVLWPSERAR